MELPCVFGIASVYRRCTGPPEFCQIYSIWKIFSGYTQGLNADGQARSELEVRPRGTGGPEGLCERSWPDALRGWPGIDSPGPSDEWTRGPARRDPATDDH